MGDFHEGEFSINGKKFCFAELVIVDYKYDMNKKKWLCYCTLCSCYGKTKKSAFRKLEKKLNND